MYILTLISLITFLNLDQQEKSQLVVTVQNIKNPAGQLIVALFNSEETFLKKPIRSKKIDVNSSTSIITFDKLTTGTYSVSIIYDKNKNGELDKNFFGIPKEGFAFSRKSLGAFGPPSYDDTKVNVDKNEVAVTIPLKYM